MPTVFWQTPGDKGTVRPAILSPGAFSRRFFTVFFARTKKVYYICIPIRPFDGHTVDVAQSVRASDCGSESRGFEPHLPPEKAFFGRPFFIIHKLPRTYHSEYIHPEKGNIPKFCQDIETRNRDLQSPNKPHTFAITVFENKEYDKYHPL